MTAWCEQSLIARPCDVFDFCIMYFDLNSPYALYIHSCVCTVYIHMSGCGKALGSRGTQIYYCLIQTKPT